MAHRKVPRRFSRNRYVIVYDVSDDRRRERLASMLLDIGVRVGLSVFHASFRRTEAERVLRRAAELIDATTDRVHLYRLCRCCESATLCTGAPWLREPSVMVV